jgi:hypothetical protein
MLRGARRISKDIRMPNEIPSVALLAALGEALAAYEAGDQVALLRARARVLEIIIAEGKSE